MAYGDLKVNNLIYDTGSGDATRTVISIPQTASPTFTGNITINAQGDFRFADADSSNYVGFQAPATVTSNLVWTLPAADGSANQLLKTDGSGNLGWATDSATDSTKLPLAGGTMSGDINLGTNDITNGGTITGTFSGNLTGNVTGNASGTAATVTGAAQTNITSLGTLTGLTVAGDVTLDNGTNAGKDIVWDESANALEFSDDTGAYFGASDDLKIYHSSGAGNSFLSNTGGQLLIRSTTGLQLGAPSGEVYFAGVENGAAELYHDNTKRLETSAAGITVSGTTHTTGSFTLLDNGKLICGAGNDLQISSNGSKGILEGSLSQAATAVSALELDLNTSNYFTKTISGNSTFTFANPASSGTVTAFTLELTHSSGTVTWPSSVKWNADTAPTLTTGKTHLFMFVTDDGGARYRGSALVDYVN